MSEILRGGFQSVIVHLAAGAYDVFLLTRDARVPVFFVSPLEEERRPVPDMLESAESVAATPGAFTGVAAETDEKGTDEFRRCLT